MLLGACFDASSFRLLPVSMGARSTRRTRTFPALFVTRSREKTCDISHDIYRLHVEEAQQAWHRAELHVEGVETSRQSDQLGNVIPPNTRSREKTHAITHDIYRLHVEGAVPSTPHVEGAQQARRLSGQRGLECFHIFFGSSPRRAEARQQAAIGQCLPNAIANLSRQTLMSRLIEGDKGQVRR